MATQAELQRLGEKVRERPSTELSRLIGQLVDSARTEEDMTFVEYPAVLDGCLELLSALSAIEGKHPRADFNGVPAVQIFPDDCVPKIR